MPQVLRAGRCQARCVARRDRAGSTPATMPRRCNARSPARSSGAPPPSSPGRRSATARSSPPCGARAATRPSRPAGDDRDAGGLADRRRLQRGGGDRGRRSRTRSRSTGRATGSRSSSRSTAAPSADATPSAPARPAPTSCSSCRAAARCARRTRPSRRRRATLLAFSDANAAWEPGALRALLAPFADPAVGYVCGQVRFVNDAGHQPGGPVLALRDVAARERVGARVGHRRATGRSTRCGADAYMHVDAVMGHDLSFPFTVVKRGRRAVYAPDARATEKMVPVDRGRVARASGG